MVSNGMTLEDYMANLIRVGMADLKTGVSPKILTTLGLGSCVGISLYDEKRKIGGMAHVMLPDSSKFTKLENPAKYADSGIDMLIEEMIKLGAVKKDIIAKIAGGAQMFAFGSSEKTDILRIGECNVMATKENLKKHGIPIIAEDTGLNYGRTIEFYLTNGDLLIKSVGKENKII